MAENYASDADESSIGDDRVRKLFQVCDANGDGFIDSQDLLAVCRELSLEDSLDELMQQLGADSQGKISYEQFSNRRLALKPEINALKKDDSENSQGKLDSWDWDSGARDMSPDLKSVTRKFHMSEEQFKERLDHQLNEQAQRYEEQITELHSVIAELTRKLHQQRSMAIAEEDEVSESCTSNHDESMTCPLDETELEPSVDLNAKISMLESPLSELKLIQSNYDDHKIVDSLNQQIVSLKQQLHDAHTRLAQITLSRVEAAADEETVTNLKDNLIVNKETDTLDYNNYCMLSPEYCKRGDDSSQSAESPVEFACDHKQYDNEDKLNIKCSTIVPIHKTCIQDVEFNVPVTKIAERIKLKSTPIEKNNLPTAVAERLVGDILRQCDDLQTEKQAIDFEISRRLTAKLEYTRSQNTVLALTLNETKGHCDRLALLCGKYESNAIALRLALGITDRTIEAYDVLLALFETELSLNIDNIHTVQNRIAAETVAKQLLCYLETHQPTDVLLSPWQNHVYNIPIESTEPWTKEHELRLREHVSRLKAERSKVQGTCVTLESIHLEQPPIKLYSTQESRKMDLEMAALMQELMSLRVDKSELLSKLCFLEKDKQTLESKLRYVETKQHAQAASLKNLQEQLKDTEGLLALATQNKDMRYSDSEHAQGVELELMQALAREERLKIRLHELVSTLEQVTKNAEIKMLEGKETVQNLNHTNKFISDYCKALPH